MSLRHLIQKAMRSLGIEAFRFPRGGLTGRDLGHDLRTVLGGGAGLACFDVGANRGQTIRLLRRVLRQPRIFAFEPAEENFRRLRDEFAGGDVEVLGTALGAEPGDREFIEYERDDLSSFLPLTASAENPFHDTRITRRTPVSVTTVDAFCAQHGLARLDLLKLDTQGFDLEVLRGAAGLVGRRAIRVVQIEVNFAKLYEGQPAALEIIGWLNERGYGLVDLYEKMRTGHHLGWATALFLAHAG